MGMIPEILAGHRMQTVYAWHITADLSTIVSKAIV